MSILIKGLKMPKGCLGCPCINAKYNECMILQRRATDVMTRMTDCPLTELPDHGDLIEKRQIVDALAIAEKNVSEIQRGAETEKDIRYCQGVMVGYANSILVIDNAPVIIPAERSEE